MSEATQEVSPTWLPKCELEQDDFGSHVNVDGENPSQSATDNQGMPRVEEQSSPGQNTPIGYPTANSQLWKTYTKKEYTHHHHYYHYHHHQQQQQNLKKKRPWIWKTKEWEYMGESGQRKGKMEMMSLYINHKI